MKVVAYDTETCLFRDGVRAPELVCITWARPGLRPDIVHANDAGALPLVESWLRSNHLLVGHNVVYDNAVLCAKWPHLVHLFFAKYDRDEIVCTKLRQQLLDISTGTFQGFLKTFEKEVEDKKTGKMKTVKGERWIPYGYSLDDIWCRLTSERLDKDTYRLRYGEFMGVPITQWPEGARGYALKDAACTLAIFQEQEGFVEHIPDQYRQARAAWALHLTSLWGLRTHKAGVDALEEQTLEGLRQIEEGLKTAGLVRADGSRDTKAAQARMLRVCGWAEAGEGSKEKYVPVGDVHKPLRLTDGGAPSLDSDACEASGDSLLEEYAELTSLKNVLSKDIPVLRAGTVFPVHTSFGLAASGRSTSGDPNVQNPRRLSGIRECFVPREGKVFAQADFSALELHTLAQVCMSLFGKSTLAEVLNAGLDPHTAFACDLLGISYEKGLALRKSGDETFDNARQTAKVANFGFPGGLGAESFCLFARKNYGVHLTEEHARDLKAAWLERWPEMKDFFKHCGDLAGDEGDGTLTQLFSGRIRGGCHYTALCNSWFQGLGADAAKEAFYLVSRACYAELESVLYGSRPVNFVHDEIIMEVDDDPSAHDKAIELGRLMVLGANEFLPDVPSRVEPLLARCWSKKSKPIYDAKGRLVPWAPELVAGVGRKR
jgi:hypothetical protein